ncbi:MAG: ATP-binding protein [Balneolaceae bacterium]
MGCHPKDEVTIGDFPTKGVSAIHTDFQKTGLIEVEKTKLIHTLVNLLKNAKEAMEETPEGEKTVTLKTSQDEENVYLTIRDNGKGATFTIRFPKHAGSEEKQKRSGTRQELIDDQE